MRLALTVGDPAGIGPEIAVKAVAAIGSRPAAARPDLLVVGCAPAVEAAGAALGLEVPPRIAPPGADWTGAGLLPVAPDLAAPPLGQVGADAGRFAFLAIERAVSLAREGSVAAIVTGPLNKEALNLAGYPYAGHTDMLAAMTGVSGSVMMLAHGAFRVTHVSTHVPLRDAARLLTPERLRLVLDLTIEALATLGLSEPRVAVAALNPHAGEGGIFGREDIEVTSPVVAEYRARGHAVDGPVPGDTVFVKLRGGSYDAVVAIYHDQGHIPVKLLGFRTDPATGKWEALNGVNVTLGLPIIRTSVDHGTAFDIAGRGIASADSLVEAIDYAAALAVARNNKGAEKSTLGGEHGWTEASPAARC